MAIGEHAIVNGTLIPASQAVLPVGYREVQYAFSVYEVLRVTKGHLVHMEDHLRRLKFSADGIHLIHGFRDEEIADWTKLLVEHDDIQEAKIRILIYGGKTPLCIITADAPLVYPDLWYTEGVSATVAEGERYLPRYKTGNLLLNYLFLRQAEEVGAFEAVLVNRYGQLLEGTRSNFFAFEEDKLYTASDELVLEGITRDRVIRAAQELGIGVVFSAPTLQGLQKGSYDEVFISSTSMGALPLKRLGDQEFPQSFERTAKIHKLIRLWELED